MLKVLLLFILFILFNLRKEHLLAGSPFLLFRCKSITSSSSFPPSTKGISVQQHLKTLDDSIKFPTVNLGVLLIKLRPFKIKFHLIKDENV